MKKLTDLLLWMYVTMETAAPNPGDLRETNSLTWNKGRKQLINSKGDIA
jgi:hypothetical protein